MELEKGQRIRVKTPPEIMWDVLPSWTERLEDLFGDGKVAIILELRKSGLILVTPERVDNKDEKFARAYIDSTWVILIQRQLTLFD